RPVVSPTPLIPCGWNSCFPLTLLPLIVKVISVCSGPLRSTISPAPPAAHGTKTDSRISFDSLTVTAAFARPKVTPNPQTIAKAFLYIAVPPRIRERYRAMQQPVRREVDRSVVLVSPSAFAERNVVGLLSC